MAVERIKLPGFGLPVNYRPKKCFPTAVLDWSGTILTVRELNMMAIMNKTTIKPDWDQKVFDDTIAHKWRQEALATEGMDVSEKMLDWVGTTSFQDTAFYRRHIRAFVALPSQKTVETMPTHTSKAQSSLFNLSYILAHIHLCHHLLSTSTLCLSEKPQDGLTTDRTELPILSQSPVTRFCSSSFSLIVID